MSESKFTWRLLLFLPIKVNIFVFSVIVRWLSVSRHLPATFTSVYPSGNRGDTMLSLNRCHCSGVTCPPPGILSPKYRSVRIVVAQELNSSSNEIIEPTYFVVAIVKQIEGISP